MLIRYGSIAPACLRKGWYLREHNVVVCQTVHISDAGGIRCSRCVGFVLHPDRAPPTGYERLALHFIEREVHSSSKSRSIPTYPSVSFCDLPISPSLDHKLRASVATLLWHNAGRAHHHYHEDDGDLPENLRRSYRLASVISLGLGSAFTPGRHTDTHRMG